MAAARPQHGLRTTARPIHCCTTLAALVIAANFYFSLSHKPIGAPTHRRRAAATANASTLRAEPRAALPVADADRSAPPVAFDGLFAREEPIDETAAAEDLTCASYSGPMYFPYGGRYKVKRRTIRAARIDGHGGIFGSGGSIAPTPLALIPFSLHDLRLLAPSRFALGFATNLAYLRHLDSDRLLYFFRKVARLPQPKPKVLTPCPRHTMPSLASDHIMPSSLGHRRWSHTADGRVEDRDCVASSPATSSWPWRRPPLQRMMGRSALSCERGQTTWCACSASASRRSTTAATSQPSHRGSSSRRHK